MSAAGWKITSSPLGVNLESKIVSSGDAANLNLNGDVITLNSESGTVINGNLVVNGTTTTIDTENIAVNDPLISLARNNEANTLDIGFYGKYVSDGDRYTGMFYDASDSKFKLFRGLSVEPTTTVNSSHESFVQASLVANVEGTVSSINNFTTDDLSEGTSNFYYADSKARTAITATGNAISYNNESGVITVNLANTALPMFSAFKQNYSSSGSATDLVRFNSEDVTVDTIEGWSLVTHLYTTNQDGKYRISFSFTPGEFSPDISLILYKDGVETTRKVTNYVSGGNVRGTVSMDIIEELVSGTSLGVRITIDRISFPTTEVILENVSFVVQMLPENYFFPTSGVSESPVVSVNGQSGVVLLNTSNIPEGSQAYFTNERARNALSAGDGILYDNITGVITSVASSQWEDSGNDLFYTAGNVGIGTNDPQGALHVNGTILQNNIAIGHGAATVTEPVGTVIDTTKQFNFVEGAQNGPGGRGIWATKMDGSGNDQGRAVETDSSGNVYVTGFFASDPLTIYNSDGNASGITLSNAGSNGAFIVKYNSSGVAQWATRIDGTGDDRALGLAVDASGNVYVTGSYTGTVTIYSVGNISFGTLANAGGTAAFVVKYNTSGTAQWATRIDGTGNDQGDGITVDSSGNVYVTGRYTGTVTIYSAGDVTFGTLANAGELAVFVVKYNSSGTAQWSTRIDGTLVDIGDSIAVSDSGDVYVTYASYSNFITVYNSDGNDSGILIKNNLYSLNQTTVCSGVIKFNSLGIAQWATKILMYGLLFIFNFKLSTITRSSIKLDTLGSLVVSFRTTEDMSTTIYNSDESAFKHIPGNFYFGKNSFSNPSISPPVLNILLKYNSDGFCQWVTHSKTNNILEETLEIPSLASVAIDSSDNIYQLMNTGSSDIRFISSDDSLFGSLYEFINANIQSVAIVKYDTNGNARWVTGISSPGNSADFEGCSLAVGSDDNVYITGFSTNTINISNSDKTSFGTLTTTGQGAFLIKFTGEGGVFKPYDLPPLEDTPENQGRTITLVNKISTPADIFIRDSNEEILDIMQIRKPLKFVFYGDRWYPL
jgi:hypothetical protein